MIVVDASAIVAELVVRPVDRRLSARLREDGDLHAPHLLDVEMLHALRRLVRTGAVSAERATDARADYADLTITRYPHHPLADRIWQMRENLTAYDAAYVALSEALDAPLITCDARLASAPDHDARIEVFDGR